MLSDEVLIELAQQHLMRAAMASLDARNQKILNMPYRGAASYSEIAEIGVSETSISPLRQRRLNKLAKLPGH